MIFVSRILFTKMCLSWGYMKRKLAFGQLAERHLMPAALSVSLNWVIQTDLA